MARQHFSVCATLILAVGLIGCHPAGIVPPLAAERTPAEKVGEAWPEFRSLPPDVQKEYVVMPGGLWHRSCLHEVPKGATVFFSSSDVQESDGTIRHVEAGDIKEPDGTIRHSETCKYPHFSTVPHLVAPPSSSPLTTQ